MQPIKTDILLSETIARLELQQAAQGKELRKLFHQAYDSLQPSNIVTNMVEELTTSDKFTDMVMGSSVGLAVGFVSKKLIVGASDNPLRQLVGNGVMLTVANLLAHHPDTLKRMGKKLFDLLKSKKAERVVVKGLVPDEN